MNRATDIAKGHQFISFLESRMLLSVIWISHFEQYQSIEAQLFVPSNQ